MGNCRGGFIADAEAHDCRGGAAMVHARMMFQAQATTEDLRLGAGLQSIVVFLSVSLSVAHIYVHWAEVRKTDMTYHMNYTISYIFKGLSGSDCADMSMARIMCRNGEF